MTSIASMFGIMAAATNEPPADRQAVPLKLYASRAWRSAARTFLAINQICVFPDCLERARHVDHIVAHKGDETLFWDTANWQGLCAHHHNSTKAGYEASVDAGRGCDADGYPLTGPWAKP